MRKLLSTLAVFGLILGLGFSSFADDDKKDEKTIEGEAQCAKCTLKETKSCQAVVTVKEDGKDDVKYYLKQNDAAKKVHDKICPPNSKAKFKATGTVTEKDGKKILEPTKVEVVEE